MSVVLLRALHITGDMSKESDYEACECQIRLNVILITDHVAQGYRNHSLSLNRRRRIDRREVWMLRIILVNLGFSISGSADIM